MKRRDWVDWALYGATVGAVVYSVYAIASVGHEGEASMTDAKVLLAVSGVCKAIAERFGRWGILAEVEYRRILERERMN